MALAFHQMMNPTQDKEIKVIMSAIKIQEFLSKTKDPSWILAVVVIVDVVVIGIFVIEVGLDKEDWVEDVAVVVVGIVAVPSDVVVGTNGVRVDGNRIEGWLEVECIVNIFEVVGIDPFK